MTEELHRFELNRGRRLAERAQQLNHDFRTPIGTIATALELLRDGNANFDNADMEAFNVAERQVAKLTQLSESLREMADEMMLHSTQSPKMARDAD